MIKSTDHYQTKEEYKYLIEDKKKRFKVKKYTNYPNKEASGKFIGRIVFEYELKDKSVQK